MITVNLELSKQLKANGYPQRDSYFYFMLPENKEDVLDVDGLINYELEEIKGFYLGRPAIIGLGNTIENFASPTADEILKQLPNGLSLTKDPQGKYKCAQYEFNTSVWQGVHKEFFGDCLADAAAKCWLYLKENNLLEVKG